MNDAQKKQDTDVFDLMRKLVEAGKWDQFYNYAMDKYEEVHNVIESIADTSDVAKWLLLSVDPDGVRVFCRLVCEFEEREGRG